MGRTGAMDCRRHAIATPVGAARMLLAAAPAMALTFYMTPGSCSTGIHILLERLELPFAAHVLNLPAGQHREPAYLAINPKGSIPTLVLDDGRALCEFEAIALWLARRHPRAGLLPDDPVAEAQAIGLMADVVGHLHGQAFTRVFTPERYLPPALADAPAEFRLHEAWREAVVSQGREMALAAFARIAARLPEGIEHEGFAFGPRWGVADAALFYPEFWAEKTGLPLPARCAAHLQRMRAQPVVRQVLAEEGYR